MPLRHWLDFIKASGEDNPELEIEILIDGISKRKERITKENLFNFNNSLILTGEEVTSGEHTIEIKASGKGPLYYNAYLTNFSLEDYIRKTGLEVKIERIFFTN